MGGPLGTVLLEAESRFGRCKHRPELCPAQVVTVFCVTAAGREYIVLLVTLIIKM